MKWSTPLPTASIGIRLTALQSTPSVELAEDDVVGRALRLEAAVLPGDVRVPAPSISALGSGLVRKSPATGWKLILETRTSFDQVAPPSCERNAAIVPVEALERHDDRPVGLHDRLAAQPLGRCPRARPATLHVRPPSDDVLMYSRSPSPKLSNSV